MQEPKAIIAKIMEYQGFNTFSEFINSILTLPSSVYEIEEALDAVETEEEKKQEKLRVESTIRAKVYKWKCAKKLPAEIIYYCEREKIPILQTLLPKVQSPDMQKIKPPSKKTAELLEKADTVLRHSNPLVSESLAKNIECFYHTVKIENELRDIKNNNEEGKGDKP